MRDTGISKAALSDRLIQMGDGLAAIPERLLLAHAQGKVLFIAGAGVSQSAGLPDFRELVERVYRARDEAVHAAISAIPRDPPNGLCVDTSRLSPQQAAEVKRFMAREYDVVLGLLERRMGDGARPDSIVRQSVASILDSAGRKAAPIHQALMRLASRGEAVAIATTNFDLLLEDAARRSRQGVQTYALQGIPRPTRAGSFKGVLHIHGVLERNSAKTPDLVLTDHDFGEFYLRRRIISDFIYDAARLFHLVLVGYSANDPPMRYLLSAVAADGSRFDDLKERFVFVGKDGGPDAVELNDWAGRGITPIPYDARDNHSSLLGTLQRWARLSAITGKRRFVDAEVKRIVKNGRADAIDADRDLFDHLFRRADSVQRRRLSELASKHKASFDWLDAIIRIVKKKEIEGSEPTSSWVTRDGGDSDVVDAATAFLKGRLEERGAVDWALGLQASDAAQRFAVRKALDWPLNPISGEPWPSAWRLVEESWGGPVVEQHGALGVLRIHRRLVANERSGALVRAIIDLVKPRLDVKGISKQQRHTVPKRPRKIEDILLARLTSGDVIDPEKLGVPGWEDPSFLELTALALESAVAYGLDLAQRIGWDGADTLWHLGGLHRVYHVPQSERSHDEDEPDRFHHGIAPSVKLLHAVVMRLLAVDTAGGLDFVHRWQRRQSPIHLRLLVACSRDARVLPSRELNRFLLAMSDREFWDLHQFPEIAELRARRFVDLEAQEQVSLAARIQGGPGEIRWGRDRHTRITTEQQRYWAARELKRIQITGGVLPPSAKTWLDERLKEFPELLDMNSYDEGFPNTLRVRRVLVIPDGQFDALSGEDRLRSLEAALSQGGTWPEDPAPRAEDWMREPGRRECILADLERMSDGGASFPMVWERFGFTCPRPAEGKQEACAEASSGEVARVLSLLDKLPEETTRKAIDGISYWFSVWKRHVAKLPEGKKAWGKLWPLAVEATNVEPLREGNVMRMTTAQSPSRRDTVDIDSLNSPAGRLVGVFLAACPAFRHGNSPFPKDEALRRMRDEIDTSIGRAETHVKFQLIKDIGYFLSADVGWTRKKLVSLLLKDTPEALELWRAVAYSITSRPVLVEIGNKMLDRAVDHSLDRDCRRQFVASLVLECLYAFLDDTQPVVPHAAVAQMLRAVEDEVRAHGADVIQRFVSDLSRPPEDGSVPMTAEDLFRKAAEPFLRSVWPQERSLATPGVSQALAGLPAVAHGCFAETVAVIERFLVPFECYSMSEYGLFGESYGREPRLSVIDTPEKAAALLQLLDLTIGRRHDSVMPDDLAEALEQIRTTAAKLEHGEAFQRLAALARQG